MTPAIFAYVLLFTLLLAGAAAAIEWGAQGRVASRYIWSAALALTVIGPMSVLAWHSLVTQQSSPQAGSVAAAPGAVAVLVDASVGNTQGASVWSSLAGPVSGMLSRGHDMIESIPAWNSSTAAVVLALWALVSVALSGWMIAGVYSLRRERRGWRTTTLDGVDVDVSPSTGPAVFGLIAHRIVLPAWATNLAPEHRRLVLAHECEHITARDPERLALAIVMLLVMPWNLALWWCAARLRRAIEMDCDARVLRLHPDVKEYGQVLLEVAARGRTSGPLAIPMVALLSLPSELERRLRAMSRSRALQYRSATFGALAAVVAVAAAFAAPAPSLQVGGGTREAALASRSDRADARGSIHRMAEVNIASRMIDTVPQKVDSAARRRRDSSKAAAAEREATVRERSIRTTRASVEAAQVELSKRQAALKAAERGHSPINTGQKINANMTYFPYQVEKPATTVSGSPTPHYPAELRKQGIGGEVDAMFVVDTLGHVEPGSIKLTKSTNQLFSDAVLNVLPGMRFVPAEIGGRPVKQLVEQPFTFATTGSSR